MSAKTVDYYGAMGLTSEASKEEIRAAYKLQAIRMHPDKNPNDPEATMKFQQLVEAYSVLSDPEKKRQYDTYGQVREFHGFDSDDEEEYYDDEEGCTCGHNHYHGGFHSFFAEMFARHYSRYGFNGFFDDDEDDYNERFWRRTANRKTRAQADWDSIPPVPSERELWLQSTPPDKPGRPKVTLTTGKITVEWAKKNQNKLVTHHILQVKIGNEDWKQLYSGEDKIWTTEKLVPGTDYSFRVCAVNKAGQSPWSDAGTAKTPGAPPQQKPTTNPPQPTPSKPKKPQHETKPDPKLKRLMSELELALSVEDYAKIENTLAGLRDLSIKGHEHDTLINRAYKTLQDRDQKREVVALNTALKQALKAKNVQEVDKLVNQLRLAMKSMQNCAEKKDALATTQTALQFIDESRQHKSVEEDLKQEINEAIQMRDLTLLNELIEKAKSQNVSVRDAKKAQRKIMQEFEGLRKNLNEAAANSDRISLEVLLSQLPYSFPFTEDKDAAKLVLQRIVKEEQDVLSMLYDIPRFGVQ